MTLQEKIALIDNFIDELYKMRADGLAEGDEFSIKNLVFKEFRAQGYLQSLRDLKRQLVSEQLSLN